MGNRDYYSIRTGKNPLAAGLDLRRACELFLSIYQHFLKRDYFQEYFGFHCTDDYEPRAGLLGDDIPAEILLKVRKTGLWPVSEQFQLYAEDDLFDMIEFLHHS